MIDYPSARAVALVVETGSFERAARVLSITPSAVSQRVRQLEERLGAVLIERGVPCRATEKGAWLCRHVEQVGLLEQDLLRHLPGLAEVAGQRVTLNIATNADSLGTWFLPAVAPFIAETGYLLNIGIDDQDHTADWLRSGRVLAAVTGLETPVQGCRIQRLGSLRYHATASPVFIARHFPHGVTAAAMADAPALTYDQKDRLQHRWLETQLGQGAVSPTHWMPSTQGFVDATLAGMGWALNPAALVAQSLDDGRLVELIPGAVLDVPLYWQVNRLASERLAPLTRSIVAAARRSLV
ncbi:LysR family transcriptional regulator [Haematobacter missouriensis]|uniref:ArgP/LysG family DNA-binding transcriptional regulator n=1 Tax=Haematobacter missouriensis TaxID=366616 RepID=A0A212AQ60_9RHOB|nr:LysR family transcriptional regulator ArgP [Haematobacter missouriensis]KFI30198.1 LysR family transcriptional regulator [Haematobacter missouriensis]OWJ74534.1 ArgP/LysG family DNA-binding transcriptional regulator [Haematobacter missouriensis]OWJ83640.1 ArgP/LysG family DNA-binding transcriptional regulator [Haematobacter missouriensis]